MKQRFTKAAAAFVILAAFLIPGAQAAFGTTAYETTQSLAKGLTYKNEISYSGGARVETFQLKTQAGGGVTPIVMACDTLYGGMTPAEMAAYAKSQGYNVAGLINADFFTMADKVPVGIVIEDGIYKSSPEGNNAVSFSDDREPAVSQKPAVILTLDNLGGAPDASNEGQSVKLTHFNKTRSAQGGLYLLDASYSTVSTRTSTDGWMVRFKILEGETRIGGQVQLEVTELIEGKEPLSIGSDCMILTADTQSNLYGTFQKFAVGDKVTLDISCEDEAIAGARWASGAGDILVSDSAVTDSAKWNTSIAGRNPRSALGLTASGELIYLVVDGRHTAHSAGASLSELAQELRASGCVWAVNLDGGGSSALSVRMPGNTSASIQNAPSDGSARRCGSYILLVTDAKSDGTAATLHLKNDGAILLAGSTLTLDFAAMDAGYMPVGLPADTKIASGGLGSVSENLYTAGTKSGADTLSLSSKSTGASGTGTVHIITKPSVVTIMSADTDKPLTSAIVRAGESLSLTASAKYLDRSVTADKDAFKYAVSGEIGEITPEGIFTASKDAAGKAGVITVTAGEQTASLPVTVPFEFSDIAEHWAKDFINRLYEKGIVTGTGGTSFEPESLIKRCDFILMLYRAAGEPAPAETDAFTDVPADAYYARAVAWAREKGIAQGMGDGSFSPAGNLTREQAFTFVYRALSALGIQYTDADPELLKSFGDASKIAEYALTPTATLVNMQIVGGSDGLIDPAGNLTRAQMAKILSVSLEKK